MFGHHHHHRHHHCGPGGRGGPWSGGGERGWGGRGGGFGGGDGWRGRRRPLEQGDLRYLVMALIAEQPRHGYEIIKAIEDALDGHYSPSPGVIYPLLTLLEETGLVSAEAQGAKKLYTVTDAGRAWLEAEAEQVRAAQARLEEARSRFGGAPRPEIRRAMGNLAAALQVRLGRGGARRRGSGPHHRRHRQGGRRGGAQLTRPWAGGVAAARVRG